MSESAPVLHPDNRGSQLLLANDCLAVVMVFVN